MACLMVLTKRGNTSPSIGIKTKSGLTNRITKTKIGARRKKRITRANTGIRIRTGIDIVPVLLRTRRNTIPAVIRIKIKKAPLIRIRSIRAAVCLTKIKTRARNIITNRVQALRIRTGKIKGRSLIDNDACFG